MRESTGKAIEWRSR